MEEKNYNVNTTATIMKILNGDMPDGSLSDDTVIIVSDQVMSIYVSLLSELLFNTIPDEAQADLVEKRVNIFDEVVDFINRYRCCRLHRFISELNLVIKDYQTDISIWPNTKMRNNVFSFISDFWIWNAAERNSLLVIEEVNDASVVENPQEAMSAIPVESEIITE